MVLVGTCVTKKRRGCIASDYSQSNFHLGVFDRNVALDEPAAAQDLISFACEHQRRRCY